MQPRRTPADHARRRRSPIVGLVRLLPLVLLAPLWLVSALTRAFRRLPWLEPAVYPDNLIAYEPEVGARPRRDLDVHSKAEDVFHLSTDADGWRGGTALEDARVVVVGDSFAFGYGVDEADLLTEQHPDLPMTAVASPAYSMVHAVLWLRRLGPRLRDRHVVWLVYTGNDLSDNLYPDIGTYRMPFVRQDPRGNWTIATDHVSDRPWTFGSPPRDNARLFAEFSAPGPYSDRVFAAADHLLAEAATVCADAGTASVTVMTAPPATLVRDPDGLRQLGSRPDAVDLDLPDRRLGQLSSRHGWGFVPLQPHLTPRHYFHDDMHWNPAGHRMVAELVRRVVGPTP